MEVALLVAGLLAIAIVLYMFLSAPGKRLSTRVKCLVFSVLVALMTALWCAAYGPDFWVMVQAGVVIVIAAVIGLISSSKETR